MNIPAFNTKTVELVDSIYDYLIGLDEIGLFPFLWGWPSTPFNTRMVSQIGFPVLSYLPDLIADTNIETKRIVTMFKKLAGHLAWGQTYSTEDFGADFLKKYGWTELIGLRGPIRSNDIACGFLMLGPDIEYPKHSHGAEEVYIPLSSWSLWKQGNESWISRPGGTAIYHGSWLPHGMKTEATPMLALYLWRGEDLAQKSHIS